MKLVNMFSNLWSFESSIGGVVANKTPDTDPPHRFEIMEWVVNGKKSYVPDASAVQHFDGHEVICSL